MSYLAEVILPDGYATICLRATRAEAVSEALQYRVQCMLAREYPVVRVRMYDPFAFPGASKAIQLDPAKRAKRPKE